MSITKDVLTNLIDQVQKCTLCTPFLPHGPRPVFQLKETAKILIAAQAPGRRVHETGVPFNDPSGDRLRQWMGVDRSVFYDADKIAIIPMGLCYPGTGPSGDYPPRPECAAHWRQKLLSHLPALQFTLVIGQYAHRWHLKDLPQQGVTETVRNWQHYGPLVLPLPHPSPRNNIWLKRNPWFEKQVIPPLKERIKNILGNL